MSDDDNALPPSDAPIDIAYLSKWVETISETLEITSDLRRGKLGALGNLLARGEPLSRETAEFVGRLFRGEEVGGYEVRLELVNRRRRPKTDSSKRIDRAAEWVYRTMRKPNLTGLNPKREQAVIKTAKRFHVDPKAVRRRLKVLEQRGMIFDRRSVRKILTQYLRESNSNFPLKTDSGDN